MRWTPFDYCSLHGFLFDFLSFHPLLELSWLSALPFTVYAEHCITPAVSRRGLQQWHHSSRGELQGFAYNGYESVVQGDGCGISFHVHVLGQAVEGSWWDVLICNITYSCLFCGSIKALRSLMNISFVWTWEFDTLSTYIAKYYCPIKPYIIFKEQRRHQDHRCSGVFSLAFHFSFEYWIFI